MAGPPVPSELGSEEAWKSQAKRKPKKVQSGADHGTVPGLLHQLGPAETPEE